MSIADQQKFIKRFDKKLQKKVAAYRRARANRQTHLFTVTRIALWRGIEDTLQKNLRGKKNQKAVIDAMKVRLMPEITKVIKLVSTRVKARIEGDSVVVGRVVKDTKNGFTAWFTATKMENGKYRNIYKQIYTSYNSILDDFAKVISQASEDIIEQSFGDQAKNYFNLEHAEHEGIAESLVKDSIIESLSENSGIEYQDVLDWLKSSDVEISIVRKTDTNTMHVFIGSKIANLEEAVASRGKKKQLQEIVAGAKKLAVEEGGLIINLPGSPSFMDIKRKELLKKVTDKFASNNRRVKITLDEKTQVPKRKTTTKKSTSRSSKKDTTSGLTRTVAGASSRKRRVKRGVASSPLMLLGLINKKLPGTIVKNMGSPKLENQTGKFASSAKVTEIAKTAQGFPSLGYTYQKDPYQVFESTSGSRFASVDRDPRSLIEGSIREIAMELALGRIYTRRV